MRSLYARIAEFIAGVVALVACAGGYYAFKSAGAVVGSVLNEVPIKESKLK